MSQHKSALIAMSGGVDSSVAAWVMLRRGFACEGVTMRLYENEDLGLSRLHSCCAARDVEDAADVAFRLDIPFEVADCTEVFKERVMEKFIRTYEAGGTPNPCIDCNRFMKFDLLLSLAQSRGLSHVVTGHYARVEYNEAAGRWLLRKGLDGQKDQSYVLYMLTQDQLAHTCFPLGDMTKAQVRKIAGEQGFVNARKPESQDICFVPDGDYAGFMEQYTGKHYPPGPFLDVHGNPVGRHRGAVRYTLGQRRGLGLAMGEPVYVCGKSMEENTVTVGAESMLYTKSLLADDVNWIAFDTLKEPRQVTAKTRYRQAEEPAVVSPVENGGFRLDFQRPQRAVTPGQAVVLYDGDLVLGGGTILRTF